MTPRPRCTRFRARALAFPCGLAGTPYFASTSTRMPIPSILRQTGTPLLLLADRCSSCAPPLAREAFRRDPCTCRGRPPSNLQIETLSNTADDPCAGYAEPEILSERTAPRRSRTPAPRSRKPHHLLCV